MGISTFAENTYNEFYKALIQDQRYLYYLDGLKVTLLVALLAVFIGLVIGTLIAVIKFFTTDKKGFKWINTLCNLYITIIRGTPVVVQLLIYANVIFVSRNTNPIVIGGVCFGINSGAYIAEIIRAGIESIDKGQMEAGRSLGLNNLQTMKLIILPQAIKNILPALGNEFIALIKETSVAGYIALTDLLKAAQYVSSRTWQPLPPLLIAAVIYLILVLGLTKLLSIFERRLSKGDKH